MNKRIKGMAVGLIVFSLICTTLLWNSVIADNDSTVWRGYGIYNLGNGELSLVNESISTEINGTALTADSEFTIKNNASQDITAVLGIPVGGTSKLYVSAGGKYLKLSRRDQESIVSSFNIEGTLPQESTWYTFSLPLKGDETCVLTIKNQAALSPADNGICKLIFFGDIGNESRIKGGQANIKLKIAQFEPHNIADLEGLKLEEVSDKGEISKHYEAGSISTIEIKYQPLEALAIQRLQSSVYRKPKSIAAAYIAKDYERAATLCKEYISSPRDTKLPLEQISFIEAECFRKLKQNNEYASILNSLDITKLYPANLRFKIMYDKLNIFKAQKGTTNAKEAEAVLMAEAKGSCEFLYDWLEAKKSTNLNTGAASTKDNQITIKNNKEVNSDSPDLDKKSEGPLAKLTGVFSNINYKWVLIFAAGFILGFVVGRLTKRRRRASSSYIFRD